MRKPLALPAQTQTEIKRRYNLAQRCSKWITANSHAKIGQRFGVDVKAVSAVSSGRNHKELTDEQFRQLERFFVRMRRVKALRRDNSVRQMQHDLGISTTTITNSAKGIASPKAARQSKRERLKMKAFGFLSGPAINPYTGRLTHY